LVDLDRLVGFLGLQQVIVRMAASLKQQAGFALATSLQVNRTLAQQAGHQALGKGPFTNTDWPMQQVGMGVLGAAG